MLTAINYHNNELWDLDVAEKAQSFRANVNMSLDAISLLLLLFSILIHKIIEIIQKHG